MKAVTGTGCAQLSESFAAAARLRTGAGMQDVRKLMDAFPGATPLSEGTGLKYCIKCGKKEEQLLLTFRCDMITYAYTIQKQNAAVRSANLAKFLSILAYLKGAYEICLDSLYGAIIDSISDKLFIEDKENGGNDAKVIRIDALSRSNLFLSNALIESIASGRALEKSEAAHRAFFACVMERFSHDSPDARKVLLKLGVDEALAANLLELHNEKDGASKGN